jgi:hypothetical protein
MFQTLSRGSGFLGQALDTARDAEKAVAEGRSVQSVPAPRPVAAALGVA